MRRASGILPSKPGIQVPRIVLPVLLVLLVLLLPVRTMAQELPSDEQVIQNAEQYLRSAAEAGFSGTVLVARKGTVLLHRGFGMADRFHQIGNTVETVFDIGSISKQFTKAAVLKLAEAGELSLNDPITRFFDDVPSDKRSITIDYLLKHMAGLREYVDLPNEEGDFTSLDREQARQRILGQELRFPPGSDNAYSNSGYTLLAIIVERVTGRPFRRWVRENLLLPAGLARTGWYQDGPWQEAQVAIGYGGRRYGESNSPYRWPQIRWAMMGNGGMVSSADQLLRWIEQLREGRILSEDSVRRYYGGYPPTGDPPGEVPYTAYAGGNDFGFKAVVFELFRNRGVVILTTNANDDILPMGRQVTRILLGMPVAPGPQPGRIRAGAGEEPGGGPFQAIEQALLAALHGGTPESAGQFIRQHFAPEFLSHAPMEQHLAIFGQLQESFPDAEIMNAMGSPDGRLELVIASSQTGSRATITMTIQMQPPHKITGMGIDMADDPIMNGSCLRLDPDIE
jgi:CubicO group peptidase (beta-lactamase class C family)